jgi:ribosomal protein L37AE/L43A
MRKKCKRTGRFRSYPGRYVQKEDSEETKILETIDVMTCPYCGRKLVVFDSRPKFCGHCGKKLDS